MSSEIFVVTEMSVQLALELTLGLEQPSAQS